MEKKKTITFPKIPSKVGAKKKTPGIPYSKKRTPEKSSSYARRSYVLAARAAQLVSRPLPRSAFLSPRLAHVLRGRAREDRSIGETPASPVSLLRVRPSLLRLLLLFIFLGINIRLAVHVFFFSRRFCRFFFSHFLPLRGLVVCRRRG